MFNTTIEQLDDAYYNGTESLVTDEVYDYIYNRERTDSSRTVRAPGRDRSASVKYPYTIGSLSKVFYGRDDERFNRFVEAYDNNHFMCEEKIDGIAAVLFNGELSIPTEEKLGTRVDHVRKHLDIPNTELMIRGELTMYRDIWRSNYPNACKIRTTVSGIVGSNNPTDDELRRLVFIAYEILEEHSRKPSEQIDSLKSLGFIVPKNIIIRSPNVEILKNLFVEYRNAATYDIDGIVMFYNRRYILMDDSCPKYALAFKADLEGDLVVTSVLSVDWNVSRHRRLKPTVNIDPVVIDGSRVSRASGKNARYIYNNGIGQGTMISIVKSGNVIPDIRQVLHNQNPSMPPEDDYKWDGTDLIAIGPKFDRQVKIRIMEHFVSVKCLNIKCIGGATISSMYDSGITRPEEILFVTEEELIKLPRCGSKLARKIIVNISSAYCRLLQDDGSISPVGGIAKLMNASTAFGRGFGYEKAKKLLEAYPDVLEIDSDTLLSILPKIDGFGEKTVSIFVAGLPRFLEFYNRVREYKPFTKMVKRKVANLSGFVVTFSGIRDTNLEDDIIRSGGKVMQGASKNVNIIIVKDLNGKESAKTKMAINAKRYTVASFRSEFL